MKFHLLLVDDCLDLRVLSTDDLQQILSESLRARNLLFIWAAVMPLLARKGANIRAPT
jgi:hypothetical protein